MAQAAMQQRQEWYDEGIVGRLNQTFGRRRQIIQRGLPLAQGLGLEISPNWVPLVTPLEGPMHYCDILSDDELQARDGKDAERIRMNLPLVPLTFQLKEGKRMREVAPAGVKYDYIISSHVLEHVPDFLGILEQQRELLADNGTIAFVLPCSKGTAEYFRPETTASELLNAYLLGYTRPTPAMVYEARKHCFTFKNEPLDNVNFADVKLEFPPAVWFNDAQQAVSTYTDAHCWAFTTQGFKNVMDELRAVGCFPFDIIDIDEHTITATGHCNEFYIKLRPRKGEMMPSRPEIARQPGGQQQYNETSMAELERLRAYTSLLEKDLQQMRRSTSWLITKPLRQLKNALLRSADK